MEGSEQTSFRMADRLPSRRGCRAQKRQGGSPSHGRRLTGELGYFELFSIFAFLEQSSFIIYWLQGPPLLSVEPKLDFKAQPICAPGVKGSLSALKE